MGKLATQKENKRRAEANGPGRDGDINNCKRQWKDQLFRTELRHRAIALGGAKRNWEKKKASGGVSRF